MINHNIKTNTCTVLIIPLYQERDLKRDRRQQNPKVLESSILNIDHYSHSLIYVFNGSAEDDYAGALKLIGERPGISVSKSCHYTYEKHPSIERN
jgi:hypothetical protein